MMLPALQEISKTKYDFITFLADDDNNVEIASSCFKEPGEYAEGSSMGSLYQIVLFKDHKDDENKYEHLDNFEAILCDPTEYISQLLPQGWYGIIAKKCTYSDDLINKCIDTVNQLM